VSITIANLPVVVVVSARRVGIVHRAGIVRRVVATGHRGLTAHHEVIGHRTAQGRAAAIAVAKAGHGVRHVQVVRVEVQAAGVAGGRRAVVAAGHHLGEIKKPRVLRVAFFVELSDVIRASRLRA
jgi:hypothetical protein